MNELSHAKTSTGRMSLRTVLRTRLALGYYCAGVVRGAPRLAALLYCFAFPTALLTMLFNLFIDNPPVLINLTPHAFMYTSEVVISWVTTDIEYLTYFKAIENLDIKLGSARLPLITPATKFVFLYFIAHPALDFLLRVAFMRFSVPLVQYTYALLGMATLVNPILDIISLDLLRSRLALLRQFFELNLKRNDGDINLTTQTINNCLQIYKTLIDSLTSSYFWTKIQIIIRLAGTFTYIINQGHRVVGQLKNDGTLPETVNSVLSAVVCLMAYLSAVLPAIFAELVNREVDGFRADFGNQLINCKDEELRLVLQLGSEYLLERPLNLTIWRLFRLDCSLVLGFTGLCVSYIIVIIQITGIY